MSGLPVHLQLLWIDAGLGRLHLLNADASVFEQDDITMAGITAGFTAGFGCSQPFLCSRGNCFALNLKL